jgi:raffinose/stachyose/melibiose transport system substrate-binding protein
MTMQRRTLLKRTGAAAGLAALGTTALPYGPAVLAAQDDMTLEFWDTLNSDPRQTIVEDLGASFEEENEGITVEHRGWTLEELQDTLPRVVESDQGPAVAQVNNGESLMGPMVRAGQVVDISGYVEEYGWAEGLPAGLLARNMYSADGTEFGTGQLWGVSAEAEIVGFYYNRSIFEELGAELPTTLAELEETMQAVVDAGQTPLAFGNSDGWTAIHMFGNIHGTIATREYLDGLIYRSGEQSFDDPTIIDAATKYVEWVERGFLQEGFEGITSDDAVALFESGAAAMLMQGSWQAGTVSENLGENAGFFLTPPLDAQAAATPASASPVASPAAGGADVLHVGGVGIPYSITSNAADPDLAAGLINELVSEEAFSAFVEAGLLPASEIADDQITEGTVSGDLYSSWNTALANDALGHYLDWAAPGFYDVLVSELQQLLGGQVTPEEFAANLQEFYAASFE